LTLTQGQGASIAGVNTLHVTSSYVLTQLHEQIVAYCQSSKVPGYVAGVYHDCQQSVVAHGLANVVTGAPMRDDTGFLFGSVTKVLTTTLVLQQVERGAVDLDEHVITYLPEFKLTTPGAAKRIRVRNLVSHTNGIDADLFFPDARGRGGLKAYLDLLGQHCGTLFAPDEHQLFEWRNDRGRAPT
jgi:CubicO group peptidase (beta-lactamase class C family)